ncbi:MAG: hypothetical protein HY279_02900, partial [Nitrospinae bacterium]|nr:hypothetical protein [Nitrospinota bacterium]
MKNYKIVFVILFIGITSRLVFSVFFSPIPSSGNTGDAVHYYESAVSLAEGKGYSFNGKPTANFPPGYSLILAGLFKLFFPSYKLAQFSNVIFGTISCLLTYAICKKAFGERAAFSENLFLPLLLGTILLWTYLIQEEIPSFSKVGMGEPWKPVLSGILLGLASLTRGQAILLPVALFLWIIFNRKSFSSALIAALIVSLSMIFTVLPWTMRNKEVFGSYKLISTNGGINLLIGNHHGATGAYHDP